MLNDYEICKTFVLNAYYHGFLPNISEECEIDFLRYIFFFLTKYKD